MGIKSFEDLDSWKKAHQLRKDILVLLPKLPQVYQYGLCAQLQRSCISVASNIAEGFGRISEKEKLHFYSIAEGSLTEVKDQVILARDLQLFSGEDSLRILELAEDVHKLIHGMMRYIRNTKVEIRNTA